MIWLYIVFVCIVFTCLFSIVLDFAKYICAFLFIDIVLTLSIGMYQVNSLWPCDAKWRQGSMSTLAPVMACCLTAPSHYLNQCWLIIIRSSGIHLRAILQEKPQPSVTEISLKISYLKFCSNLPGAYELKTKRMEIVYALISKRTWVWLSSSIFPVVWQ